MLVTGYGYGYGYGQFISFSLDIDNTAILKLHQAKYKKKTNMWKKCYALLSFNCCQLSSVCGNKLLKTYEEKQRKVELPPNY